MKYKNNEYIARETRAQKGAVNLLRVTDWRIKGEPALLPPALQEGLNAPDADLVILASGGSYPHGLEAAVRETRATILIIELGSTSTGSVTYYFTLVRCVAGDIRWTRALRLWVDVDRKPYLVPDEHSDNPDGAYFALDARGVVIVAAPWRDAADREFGLGQADAALLAP